MLLLQQQEPYMSADCCRPCEAPTGVLPKQSWHRDWWMHCMMIQRDTAASVLLLITLS